MTPGCCNCLYYSVLTAKCRNPESKHYEYCRLPSRHCEKWEYEKEFSDKDGRRAHYGQKG